MTDTTTTADRSTPVVVDTTTATATATPRASKRRRPALSTWVVAATAVAAATWAIVGSLWLFPLLTDNADEGAYLSQSAALRAGQLLPEAPAHPVAYHPWFSAIRDGHYVYKYTPVHASVLAVGKELFGSERAGLGVIAAAVIVLLALVAHELGVRPGAAALGCVAFACSPLWLMQSATFLPYCEALAWLLAFLFCFLRGFRLRSTWWLLGAGGFAGIACFARPFEGAVFVGAVVGCKLWTTRGRDVAKPLAWVALGALPGLALLLAYNWVATGSPFRLAFQVTGRTDSLGFGIRHVLPSDPGVNYTVGKAFSALANNMLLVITWSFGSFVGLAVATVGFSRRRDLPDRGVLSALLLVWPIAFFFFWGAYASVLLWDITKYVGPFYYLPMALVMAIAIGVGVMRLTRHRRVLIVGMTALLALVSLITLIPAIHTNQDRTAQRTVIDDLVHARLDHAGRSILFLPDVYGPYLQNPFSFLRNPPGYDGHVLYAVHGSNHEFDVLDDHPGRTPYLLSIPSGYGPDIPAAKIRANIAEMSRVRGSSLDFRITASPSLATSKPLARMIMGDKLVYFPMHPVAGGGAVARFTISRTAHGTRVTSPDDPTLRTTTDTPNHPLHVSVVIPKANFGVKPVDNRDFAFCTHGSDLELLLPGSHTMDTLRGSRRLQFDVTAGQSENE